MTDWTYIPDPSAYWRPNRKRKPMKPIPPATKHKLSYIKADDRWKCSVPGCGYVLGMGRTAFKGKCPMKRDERKHENMITLPPPKPKPRKQTLVLQSELLPLTDSPQSSKRKNKQHVEHRNKRRRT